MSMEERVRGSFRNISGSGGGAALRDYERHLDDARYSEDLVGRESASMKFQWTNLLNDNGDTTPIPTSLKHVSCRSSDGVRMTTHRESQGNPRIAASCVPSQPVVLDNKRERMSSHCSGTFDGKIVSRDPKMVLCSLPGLRMREKSIQDEFSRRKCYEEGEVRASYLKDNGRLPLASRNSNVVFIDKSYLRMPNHPRLGEVLHRKYYEEEENSMSRHLKDVSYSMMSEQKFASASPRTAMKRRYERVISTGNSMDLEHVGEDDFSRSFHEASRYPELQVKESENYCFLRGSSAEGRERCYAPPRAQASEGICLGTVSFENKLLTSASEEYGHIDRSRPRTVGVKVDAGGSLYTDNLSESLQAYHHGSLQEQPIHIYDDRHLAATHLVQEDENESWEGTDYDFERIADPDFILENEAGQERQRIYRTSSPQRFHKEHATDVYLEFDELHDMEAYHDRIPQLSRRYGIEDNSDVFLDGGYYRSSSIPDLHYGQHQTDGTIRRKLFSHELDLPDLSGHTFHKNLRIDHIECRPSSKHNTSDMVSPNRAGRGDSYGYLNGKVLTQSALPKKSRHRKIVEPSDVITNHKASSSSQWLPSPTLPLSVQRRLSKPIDSAGIEIKKPDRPSHQNTAEASRSTISSSLLKRLSKPGTSMGTDVKERLGSASPDSPNPSSKRQKLSKSLTIGPDNPGDSLVQDIKSEAKVVPAMTEPPEGSAEFKRLVKCAFLKFVKQLNESPAVRKGYTEHDESMNRLKCGICGSDSRGFKSVWMLAQHAHAYGKLTKPKRVDHLGFHRALCALMGWDHLKRPNFPLKTLKLDPPKALALKEDLIIWPPVVILHNSSIHDPDKALREEGVKGVLQGMGYPEEKAKVERGKPANFSIMVVKFNACLSGLQDAEKLHNYYAERKHGRAEFEEGALNSSTGDKGESDKVVVDKKEDFLYGYLGLAEDIDRLNFGTKEYSRVVSKMEKLAEADTPPESE